MADLDRAVGVAEKAVNATPEDHPDRAARLNNLGTCLDRRFDQTASIDDLNRAVDVAEKAVNATPEGHPDRAARLNTLGNRLGKRFERTGSMADLDRTVEVDDKAVNAIPQDHPDRARYLSNLGNSLGRRFDRVASIDDLNRAVDVANKAVNATPEGHPNQAGCLSDLGIYLTSRFERTGSMTDLDRAVEVAEKAVNATPEDHPGRAGRLNNLGTSLDRRFERTGSMTDLNRAVDVAEKAVNATPEDHPGRAGRLSNLGNRLGSRFERTGSMADLNRAVDVAEKAVNVTPEHHPDRAGILSNLGNKLGSRFQRTGSMADLDRAVEVTDKAVNATPVDHPDRAIVLNNLGICLGWRFERAGSMADIDRAVEVAEKAVNATPEGHIGRAGYLSSLGNMIGRRFERTDSMADINRAVEVAEKAINAIPEGHPDRAGRLNNLGICLGSRFERTGSMIDLDRAVEVAEKAVNATPEDHPDRSGRLGNLGNRLGSRFERTGSMADLDRAVDVAEKAVNATPQNHIDLAARLGSLGDRLGSRFERTRVPEYLEQSMSAFRKGWECRSAPPSIRIRLARKVAAHLASESQWKESSTLLDSAVQLLPLVSLRSLQHTDKQHLLAQFAGLASMAASIAINAEKTPYDALRFLELGRGVIAGLLLDMRTDITELQQQHPALADKFTFLRDELDSPADTASFSAALGSEYSVESKVKRRLDAEKQFQEVLDEIRSKEGFANFLCTPTEDELKTAASSGPVVFVNVSSYRCDALLVRQHHPISILELPELRLQDIEGHNKSFGTADPSGMHRTLGWLWDVVASPVLDALGFNQLPSDGDWPQIWWIPTGQLSQLPLHAAGRHFKPSTDTVLDRAMSSYSPSIKALLYGRRYRRNLDHQASESAVLVTVPESNLRFAGREVAMLEGLCPDLKLHPVKPAPQRDEILTQLRSCRIFHFASHGKSNPLEPSESCLVLGKDKSITVADLRDCRLQERSPFLAYLSACSTKVNQSGRLVDEDIHLVSACQLAGFRHVVGTLWEVSDEHCVDVAKTLYETIKDERMADVAVCRGLHKAIRALRDKDVATAPIRESCTMQVAVVQDKTRDRKGPVQKEHANQSESDDIVRHSDWSITGRCSQLGGPRIWAAYIHVGL